MSNRRILVIALGAVALVSVPPATLAQAYPTKPIRIVVSAAPGGSPDIISRLMSPKLTEALGQPIVIDNRAGASGRIAVEVAAKGIADGGAGSARRGAWMRPGSNPQRAGNEPRSRRVPPRSHPLEGAPAPRSGTPPDGHTLPMDGTCENAS